MALYALDVSLVWEKTFQFSFNSVAIEPTSGSKYQLLVGCADGKIRVIKDGNEEDILETKGGSIQQLLHYDFTRLGEHDVVSADADGNVVSFSHRRILFRASVGHPISSLVVANDIRGYTTLITGDRSGVVTGLQLHHAPTPLWRAQISPSEHIYKPLSHHGSPDMAIRSLLPVILPPMNSAKGGLVPNDCMAHYLLVAGSTPHIHFYTEGKRVYSLLVPSLVNSMCAGRFTDDNDTKLEIALGCENGFVYILRNFAIHKWMSIGHTISQLSALNAFDESLNSHTLATGINNPDHSNNNGIYDNMALDGIRNSQSHSQPLSLLICAGHFNALKIYSKTTLIKELPAEDWVHTFAVHGNTKSATLAAGLANNSIQVYKLYHNT